MASDQPTGSHTDSPEHPAARCMTLTAAEASGCGAGSSRA